ncbi:MAG: LysR substrate-binding domain-containing protein [Motiliproteus sp.]|nr:LysR substrate-binding domain-containing protein [Motiliproteus sp.]
MDYQNLYLFIKVLEKGSFLAASETLGIPNSTLSRKIQQLEESLGYKLMHRSARKLSLTEAGELFLRRCQPLYDELEAATMELDGELTAPSGELRITAPVSLASELLDSWFFAFMQRYPKIRLELILSNTNIDLKEEGIDIAFRIGEQKIKDWVTRTLFHSHYQVCASPAFIEQYGAPKTPLELNDYPLIVPRRTQVWSFQHQDGRSETVTTEPRIRVDELHTATKAVVAGLGIGNLPHYAINETLEREEAVPILKGWQAQGKDIQMLYPHRKYLPVKARLFIEYILSQVRQYRLDQGI